MFNSDNTTRYFASLFEHENGRATIWLDYLLFVTDDVKLLTLDDTQYLFKLSMMAQPCYHD